jgi:hypothetical protein
MGFGKKIKEMDLGLNYPLEKMREIKYIRGFGRKMIGMDMAFY